MSSLVHVLACRLFGAKTLPEWTLAYSYLEHHVSNFLIIFQINLFQENVFENIVCKMLTISPSHRCVINWSPLVPHICVSELGQHWSRHWLVACSVHSHFLDQCCRIVNWTPRNKLQWNSIKVQNFYFKKMHLKMLPAKWRPFCREQGGGGGGGVEIKFCSGHAG